MNKYVRIVLALVLTISISCPTWAATLEDKKSELKDVEQQLETKKQEKDKQDKEVKSAITLLMEAQEELAKARQEFDAVEAKHLKLQNDIKQNEIIITRKTKELEATKKVYSARLRNIYENGQINYLDVLLGAKDFSDFSSRMYLLQRIIKRDADILELLETQKKELETQRAVLEENKKQMELILVDLAAKKKLVEEKTAARRAIYDKAKAEQDRLDAEMNRLLEDSKNITAMIQNWESGGQMGSAHGTGQFMWPCNGPITSYYGWRTHPIFGTRRYHSGMDIAVDYGTPIVAADGGVVIGAGWMGGYGYAVMINHGDGLVSLYGHNSSLNVSVGETVAKGQVIASAGSTGYSTGPHCHFEVRLHGEVTEPLNYLP